MRSRYFPLVMLVAMALTACGGTQSSPSPSTPAAVATSTPSTATEAQVASMVAGYANYAQEIIDSAGECRIVYTLARTPAEEAQALSCYLQEQTIGLSSKTTAKELEALTPPASMTALVQETVTRLSDIASVDLRAACGDTIRPNSPPACSRALGDRYGMYLRLDTTLAKWSPYL